MVKKEDAITSVPKKKASRKKSGFSVISVELYNLNAQQFNNESNKAYKLIRENAVEIISIENKEVQVKLCEKIYFEPEGVFKIDLTVLGIFKLSSQMSEEEVNSLMPEMSAPMLNYSSFMISTISDRMGMIPLVVPPILKDEEQH